MKKVKHKLKFIPLLSLPWLADPYLHIHSWNTESVYQIKRPIFGVVRYKTYTLFLSSFIFVQVFLLP